MPIEIEKDTLGIALQKLKARENSFRKIESIARMGSWEVDLKTHESIWSDQSFKNYGLDKETTKPTYELFWSHIVPQDLPEVQRKIKKGIESGEVTSVTCRLRQENGNIVTLFINGQVVKDENGVPLKLVGTTQDITKQIKVEEHNKELSELIKYSSNEIYILDSDTLKYLYVNKGACDALGYTNEELLQMNTKEINPFLQDSDIKKIKISLSNTSYILNRSVHKRKDGSLYDTQAHLHRLKYQGKDAIALFITDISQIVTLEQQHEKQARILEYIHDSVIATDLKGNIMSWNRASAVLFGYSAQEMIGSNILSIYSKSNKISAGDIFLILLEKESFDLEGYMVKKNNSTIICDISLSISKDEHGEFDGYIAYIHDISEQKETQKLLDIQTQNLQYQATHDPLTNLPNRTLFKERLSQTIIGAKRHQEKFALLFIDLDHFKNVNDTLGHDIGDKVLIETSSRIQSLLREEDTLARLGGDEFTIIIKDIHHTSDPSIVASKILNTMKEPIKILNNTLYITTSIGVSIYPDDAINELNLIKFADSAMYKAKDEGRNSYQYYASDMTEYTYKRIIMETSIREALQKDHFVVYYQPQYDIKQEKIVGMEALVRWQHPEQGIISPSDFIPLAEESGLIIEIDKIVMKKAMEQFSLWYKKGFYPGVLALNLGMKQLNDERFIPNLLKLMKEFSFEAKWLELEVTEGQVMNKPETSIEKLQIINNLGIEIAIDDFGTGYSSLAYLKKLPLDKLKIDKSFVDNITTNEDDIAIAKSIIALGKSLNLKLIAEGVEDLPQKDFLKQNGCDLIQGYLYSKPIPSKDMENLLKSEK